MREQHSCPLATYFYAPHLRGFRRTRPHDMRRKPSRSATHFQPMKRRSRATLMCAIRNQTPAIDSSQKQSHQHQMRLFAVILHALIVAGLLLSNPASVRAAPAMSGSPNDTVMTIAKSDASSMSPCFDGHCPDGKTSMPECPANLTSCGGSAMLAVDPFVPGFIRTSGGIPCGVVWNATVVPPRHDPPPPRFSANTV